jgi:hypothetical protein
MSQTYVEPTLKGRIELTVFYACLAAWYIANKFILLPVTHWISALAFCPSLPWVKGEIVIATIYAILGAALLIWIGCQTLRQRRWPLLGTPVFRRKPIQTGWAVMVGGYSNLAIGLGLLAGTMYAWYRFDCMEVLLARPETVGCA